MLIIKCLLHNQLNPIENDANVNSVPKHLKMISHEILGILLKKGIININRFILLAEFESLFSKIHFFLFQNKLCPNKPH